MAKRRSLGSNNSNNNNNNPMAKRRSLGFNNHNNKCNNKFGSRDIQRRGPDPDQLRVKKIESVRKRGGWNYIINNLNKYQYLKQESQKYQMR